MPKQAPHASSQVEKLIDNSPAKKSQVFKVESQRDATEPSQRLCWNLQSLYHFFTNLAHHFSTRFRSNLSALCLTSHFAHRFILQI